MDSLILIGAIDIVTILVTCVIGGICGFLAGKIMGGSLGLVPNIVVGIVGAMLFGALFSQIRLIDVPFVNEIIGGTIGSVILLFLIGLFNKAKAAV